MADTPENAGRDQGGRWVPGQSGNLAGKPRGARHQTTRAIEALFDGEAEALTRRAVELAMDGNTVALRLCLERIAPPRKDSPVQIHIRPMKTAGDAVSATAAVIEAVSVDDLTPSEAASVARHRSWVCATSQVVDGDDRDGAARGWRDQVSMSLCGVVVSFSVGVSVSRWLSPSMSLSDVAVV